jgi:hypothetical protein
MTQQPFEHVSFDKPDEVRQGENWRLDLVNLAVGRPGWAIDHPVRLSMDRARQAGCRN